MKKWMRASIAMLLALVLLGSFAFAEGRVVSDPFRLPEVKVPQAEQPAEEQPSEEEQKAPYNYQYCIAIPIGTALAQAWNPEACQTCGDIVGEEMEMFGVHMWLAPAMNIHRSPL